MRQAARRSFCGTPSSARATTCGPCNERRRADAIARVAYEARRVYARALGEQALPDWDEAPPQQRQEALLGVEAVLCGAASTGARLHDVLTQHAHPLDSPGALFKVDYHDLPIAERRKVLLFRATVLALVDGPCTGLCHDEKCRDHRGPRLPPRDLPLALRHPAPAPGTRPTPPSPLKLYS